MPRLILLILLVFTPAAGAQTRPATTRPADKPVYMSINTADSLAHPELKPFNWLHISTYIDRPRPRIPDTGVMGIWAENIRYIATKCREGGFLTGSRMGLGTIAVAGAPAALDYEGWYDLRVDGKGNVEPGSLPKERAAVVIRDYVRTFRAVAPNVPLTVWTLNWHTYYNNDEWVAGLSESQLAQLAADAKVVRVVLDECDMVTLMCYLTQPDYVDRDLRAYARMIDWNRRTYGKPVHAWIMPSYNFVKDARGNHQVLQPDHAARLFEMARREADATVIWGDWPATEKVFLPLVKKRPR